MAKKVEIAIYDEDGKLCESVEGKMTVDEVRDIMVTALKNDGIPVVRMHKEPAKPAELPNKVPGEKTKTEAPAVKVLKGRAVPMNSLPEPKIAPMLTVEWECEGLRFHAFGEGRDVIDAQYDFLRTMTAEE